MHGAAHLYQVQAWSVGRWQCGHAASTACLSTAGSGLFTSLAQVVFVQEQLTSAEAWDDSAGRIGGSDTLRSVCPPYSALSGCWRDTAAATSEEEATAANGLTALAGSGRV